MRANVKARAKNFSVPLVATNYMRKDNYNEFCTVQGKTATFSGGAKHRERCGKNSSWVLLFRGAVGNGALRFVRAENGHPTQAPHRLPERLCGGLRPALPRLLPGAGLEGRRDGKWCLRKKLKRSDNIQKRKHLIRMGGIWKRQLLKGVNQF